jgi:hypothetical protein
VTTKLRRLPQVLNDYQVDGVPTIVVDGKYDLAIACRRGSRRHQQGAGPAGYPAGSRRTAGKGSEDEMSQTAAPGNTGA